MKLENVKTWDDYEEYMRSQGSEAVYVVDKCQNIADKVCATIEGLENIHMKLEIYDFDEQEAEIIPSAV
ncbi:MAG: hypothetical protein IJ697_00640 [Synergistaceae bacterium]|nr:hypothetical protein [Synergistaceae bacterium]MBR1656959.1 hypothetical protein [Synergistaceae bacterium]